jgi:hypothetical protein
MAAYIQWLAPQMDNLPDALRTAFDLARAKAMTGDEHLRLPAAVAHLWIGFDCGLQFAEQIGAIDAAAAKGLREEGWEALVELAATQARVLEGERPTQRFLEVLDALLVEGRVLLGQKSDEDADRRPGFIGWQDVDFLYLLPEVAFRFIATTCRDSGETFPIRQDSLAKALAREGLTECSPGRHTKVVRLGGRNRRVWALKRTELEALVEIEQDDEDGAGQNLPAPGG